jgi:aspartate kinase
LENTGVAAKVFAVVAEIGANVEMISEGASDVALNFVVPSSRAIDVIRKLHEMYIG